jgi:hypothetical protein
MEADIAMNDHALLKEAEEMQIDAEEIDAH